MSLKGWGVLVESCKVRGENEYPIAAYSEFMPPVRLGCSPYSGRVDAFFSAKNPLEFAVTEFEEAFELRP